MTGQVPRFIRGPRRVRPGDRPSATDANVVRAAIAASVQLGRAQYQQRPRPWAEVMIHEITAIEDDYLETKRVWRSSTLGSEIVYVARPALLRASVTSHNGVTYADTDAQTRTASKSGQDDETQRITPPYVVGDWIEVTVIRGLTGVTEVDEQRGAPVDANRDGRVWATDPAA